MDGIDLNVESVQAEPLIGRPAETILQNEILGDPTDVTALAVENAPKNQYLQVFTIPNQPHF